VLEEPIPVNKVLILSCRVFYLSGKVGVYSVLDDRVKDAIEKIRPALQADGGDIELVGVEGGVVKVRLRGACAGCPMSQMTLKMGVEQALKKQIPEVKSVEAVE
jgi:Fe-S cluster biogenesis protein NfuA